MATTPTTFRNVRMLDVPGPKCTDANLSPAPSVTNCVLWTIFELGTALICACLPTYGPLLQRFLSNTGIKIGTSYPLSNSVTLSAIGRPDRAYVPISKTQHSHSGSDHEPDSTHLWSATRVDRTDPRSIPLNAIAVDRSIEVV